VYPKYLITALVIVGLAISAITIHQATQRTVLAQSPSSMDMNMNMDMNATTAQISKMHLLGKSIPVLVHISSGESNSTHEVHSALMGVDHALAMLRQGKDVSILLDVDGVRIAAKNVTGPLEPVSKTLQLFLNEGGRVIACDHCVKMAGLTMENLLPGIEFDTHPEMPKMQKIIDQHPVVLDY
jgi:predicted peroxiredoxin